MRYSMTSDDVPMGLRDYLVWRNVLPGSRRSPNGSESRVAGSWLLLPAALWCVLAGGSDFANKDSVRVDVQAE